MIRKDNSYVCGQHKSSEFVRTAPRGHFWLDWSRCMIFAQYFRFRAETHLPHSYKYVVLAGKMSSLTLPKNRLVGLFLNHSL